MSKRQKFAQLVVLFALLPVLVGCQMLGEWAAKQLIAPEDGTKIELDAQIGDREVRVRDVELGSETTTELVETGTATINNYYRSPLWVWGLLLLGWALYATKNTIHNKRVHQCDHPSHKE